MPSETPAASPSIAGVEPVDRKNFMLLVWCGPASILTVLLGLVILQDRAPEPIFARWLGYANFLAGLLLVPACLIPLFTTGPLAWNGVFSFWIPVIEFTAWFFLMVWALRGQVARGAIP